MTEEVKTPDLSEEFDQIRKNALNEGYRTFLEDFKSRVREEPFKTEFSIASPNKTCAEYYLMRLVQDGVNARLLTNGVVSTSYTIYVELPIRFDIRLPEPKNEKVEMKEEE